MLVCVVTDELGLGQPTGVWWADVCDVTCWGHESVCTHMYSYAHICVDTACSKWCCHTAEPGKGCGGCERHKCI